MEQNNYSHIKYGIIPAPKLWDCEPVPLTDETMRTRFERVKKAMSERNLDALCVYGDREHGGNFEYLTGFWPRFEETLLILHQNGPAYLLLGNESLKMGPYCRIKDAKVIHVPHFSLPNQPMKGGRPVGELFRAAGLSAGMHVGIAGWKMFTSPWEDNHGLFEVPSMIVDKIRDIVGSRGSCTNVGELLIHPGYGVRVLNNANEIAYFEYGAAMASNCVYRVMEAIAPGKTELEVASELNACGQPLSVQPICAGGERFTRGEVAPRNKKVCEGDPFSVTMGLRGGLTSRSGYVVYGQEGLPKAASDYMEAMVKPYFAAAVQWYEHVDIGVTGGELYEQIEHILPPSIYGWVLNPGHLTASEEWLSSPIYPGSCIDIKSGMLLQMDIIPKRPGYGGINCEDGIAVADTKLRHSLALLYPKTWERILARRKYMIEILGIQISDGILPLSNTEGYLRPYLLEKSRAMYVER